MKKNKKAPAGILLCLALGALFLLRASGYIREIHGSLGAIAQYRGALRAKQPLPPGFLLRLENRAAELREQERPEGKAPAALEGDRENPAAAIRGLLQTHDVAVERLRSLSTGGSAGTEWALSAAPVNFLRFLQAAAELSLPLTYISIKAEDYSSPIKVTVRYSHAP
jgi:hypothetical protein